MIISHSHKFVFLKSVKTAGTSLEAALSQFCSGNDTVTPLNDFSHNRNEKGEFIHHAMNAEDYRDVGQHVDLVTLKSRVAAGIVDDYFKFSIARNPWDRLVSLFTWKARNNPELQARPRFYHRLGVPFDQLAETRWRFARFVKNGEWDTNDRFYVDSGALGVDYVILYESLVDGFREVCSRIGVPAPDLPRLKSGLRPGQYHYSQYYDDELRTIIGERHANDIRLFGYRFERP